MRGLSCERRGRGFGRSGIQGDRLVGAEAIDDSSLLEVVRSHLHSNSIAREDVDPVHPHASRKVTEKFVILGLGAQNPNTEHRVGERLDDKSDELEYVLCHAGGGREAGKKPPYPTDA